MPRMSAGMATCGALMERISGTRYNWCTLAPEHPGPHASSIAGIRWREGGPVAGFNPNAPQIRQVDRCANMSCGNRPGEGTFTLFAIPDLTLALCAPCAEKMKAVWPG